MHQKTIFCVAKAESLIASGDEDSLRYACLELRMGIEHLFYSLIPLYEKELPADMLKKWKPQHVIAALLECDPNVDGDITISFVNSDDHIVLQRENKAVTKQLINEFWHSLGSRLHASMAGKSIDLVKLRAFLHTTIEALRAYSADKVLCNVARFAECECVCGRIIRRNVEALKIKPLVTCPDEKCGAMWEYTDRGDEAAFTLVSHSYTCRNCKNSSKFGAHLAIEGMEITCCHCEAVVRLRRGFLIEPVPNAV